MCMSIESDKNTNTVNEVNAYTLKEIAEICQCAKNTAKRQVERLKLHECFKLIGTRQYPAYYATNTQIEDMKAQVLSNKNLNMSASSSTQLSIVSTPHLQESVTQTGVQREEYKELEEKYKIRSEEYYKIKELLAVAESHNRLLTDQQGGLVQQMRDLTKDKEALIAEKARIETRLEEKERESTNYKRLSFFTSLFAGLILLSVVVALVFKVLLH